MAIAEFSVVPLGTGQTSLSEYVAECYALVKASGLKHELTPMGTIIEGSMTELLDLLARVHEVPFTYGVQRVYTSIKIDDRRDKTASMEQKICSVIQLQPES